MGPRLPDLDDPARRRCLAAAFAAVVLPASAPRAAEADPVYAVVSLLGDRLHMVGATRQTGSRIDRSPRASTRLSANVFDEVVLVAAGDALKDAMPKADVALFKAAQPMSDEEQRELYDGETRVRMPPWMADTMKRENVARLLLVSNFRAPAQLRMRDGTVGSGMLEGVGYYIDNDQRTQRTDTGESGTGFLSPYAYVRFALIDPATQTVVRSRSVTASMSFSAAQAKDGHSAADVFDDARKVEVLKRLLREQVVDVVPRLTAGN